MYLFLSLPDRRWDKSTNGIPVYAMCTTPNTSWLNDQNFCVCRKYYKNLSITTMLKETKRYLQEISWRNKNNTSETNLF